MYEAYWNLTTKPFCNTTDRRFFFYGEVYEETYLRLLYSITESKGLLVLTGEGGCGKTFVAKIFMKDMIEQGHSVGLISNPDVSPCEFLQQLSYEFGLDYQNKSKAELIRSFQQFALETQKKGRLCILIIDEAHLIQNEKTLEEIALLLNLEDNGRFLVSVILLGKPAVEDNIQKVSSLRERIGLYYRIRQLNCKETGEYIYHRMEKAGCGRQLFTTDAIREIFRHSGGILREINKICDLALLVGYEDNAIIIDQTLVLKAIEDLKGGVFVKK